MARKNTTDPFWEDFPALEHYEADARKALIKQIKLMFELGITSPTVSAVDLRALYSSSPEENLACGVSARPEVSEACENWGATMQLRGPIGLCQRLLSSHIAPVVFSSELDACLDILARPELAEPTGCAVEYRNLTQMLVERLLIKAFASVQKPADVTQIQGLPAALNQVDRWYAAAALAFAQFPAELSDATGRVLLSFWNRVYAAGAAAPISFPGGASGSEDAGTLLDELFGKRLDAHRQVLTAAYSDPAPLDEVPLLLITADALTPLQERLQTSAPLYDFACRIIETCTADNANEATRLLRLIGALGDSAALDSALADSATVRADWLTLFTALRDRRPVLEESYRRATGRPGASLGELYQPGVSGPAAGLAELVSRSSDMWTSYAADGVLLPRDGDSLRASLSQEARTTIVGIFNGRISQLNTAFTSYVQTRGDFANTILARINQRQHLDRLFSEIALLQQEYNDLGEDLHGMMSAQDHANLTSGRFLATYVERASDPAWLPNYRVDPTPQTIQIAADAARGGGAVGNVSQIPEVAIRDPESPSDPLLMEVGKGDMLTFEVTGQWAPTCALRDTTLVGPNGVASFVDPTGALTGSEGYLITWENGSFKAREKSTTKFSSTSTESSICGAISAGLASGGGGGGGGGGSPSGAIGSATISGSYCKQWQTGRTTSDSSSSGQRTNAGASFAGGMRVPGTPFPSMPGGSLLAVQVEGAPGNELVTDVQVIRPRSTLVFDGAAKVYLVVNDKGGCNGLNNQKLTVNLVHAKSTITAAAQLAQTMANVLTTLNTKKQLYIAQGSVTSAELNELQRAAYDQLSTTCGCDLVTFPEQIRGMFDAWLSGELAGIERQTRIASTIRALDRLVLRLESLRHDVSGAQDSSRLSALMTSWQLGHLAFHQLRGKANDVLNYGNDFILPMLRIRYPQALFALRTDQDSSDDLQLLRTAAWTLPFDQQADLLREVAQEVSDATADAHIDNGDNDMLMVAFPRPGETTSVFGANVAAAERSVGVWEPCTSNNSGFCLKRRPIFTISPEDVYGFPGAGLGCGEAAPIIKAAAFYAVNTSATLNLPWNTSDLTFDIFRLSDATFPVEDGLLNYRVGGMLEMQPGNRMRSLGGGPGTAASVFETYAAADRDFDGTSPFGTFALDLGSFATDTATPLGLSHTLVVIFEVETRSAFGPMRSVARCRQGSS
jgi:hypothetical protein